MSVLAAPRRNGRTAFACLALTLASFAATSARSQAADTDRQAALKATLDLADLHGEPLTAPVAGQAFSLTVALTDAATGQAPPGIYLEGWLRPVSSTDLPCTEAARAFRATRRIPTGGIDLNGVLLASFNSDGSFGIADPRLDLATANMLAAGRLQDKPPRLVVADRVSQRIHTLGHDNKLRIVTPGGQISEPDTGGALPALVAMQPDDLGGMWLAGAGPEGKTLLHLDVRDDARAALTLASPILGLRRTGPDRLLLWTAQEALVLNAETGDVIQQIATDLPNGPIRADGATLNDQQGGDISYYAFLADGDDQTGYLVWADAPDDLQPIALPAPASHVAIDPDSGKVLFWDPVGAVSIVDPISGAVAAALDLHGGIAEIAFAGNAAFLAAPDNSNVSVVDLPTVTPGKAPAVQSVRLGAADSASDHTGLMVSLTPSPQTLAVHSASQTGFIVDARNSMGEAPPMSAVRLRGGQPTNVAVLDRSFREITPGQFRTGTTLPQPGAWELVVTTGIGGLSTCFDIDATAPAGWTPPKTDAATSAPRLALLSDAVPAHGAPVTLALGLRDERAQPVPAADSDLSVTALEYGWRQPAQAELQPDGTLRLTVTFPTHGLYLIEMPGAEPPLILDVP